MANDEHVALLKKGVEAWNAWREENPNIRPDLFGAGLSEANLSEANLAEANLSMAHLSEANLYKADLSEASLLGAHLSEANLSEADLYKADLMRAHLSEASLFKADLLGAHLIGADLSRANLSEANLLEAHFIGAHLSEANLTGANLTGANLSRANLSRANLSGANLSGAALSETNLAEANLNGTDLQASTLLDTDFTGADLTGCRIYGVSAWGLKLEGAKQQNLVITPPNEPEVTVDNIEVAQFIYLMLNNQKVRDVIDTITSKAVLILGRFTQERKPVLEALREELRQRKYLPILFDFEKPRSRNTDETITLLARMARFVVADISDAKSVLQELRAIVPDLPSVPVQPIILAMQEEPGMFDFYRNFRSFLNVHRYASQEQLIADLGEKVIRPAELKVLDLQGST
jgi:uncharacterized protein YjbI with pentapeptide repeats